jgi:hypothetical protein
MNGKIFSGCQDCYSKVTLRDCPEELLPEGVTAQLCSKCIATRKADRGAGRTPRSVGITADEPGMKWVDSGASVTFGDDRGDKHVAVVQYQTPVAKPEEVVTGKVRFRLIPDLRWLPAAELNFLPTMMNNPTGYALNSVMNAIRVLAPRAKMLLVRQKKS